MATVPVGHGYHRADAGGDSSGEEEDGSLVSLAQGHEAASGPHQDFSTGLCDCFDDMSSCCLTFWCQCIQQGRNQQGVQGLPGENTFVCVAPLVASLLCGTCVGGCLSSYFEYNHRRAIRRYHGYKMEGTDCHDAMVAACCGPCSSCQIAREIKRTDMLSTGFRDVGAQANLLFHSSPVVVVYQNQGPSGPSSGAPPPSYPPQGASGYPPPQGGSGYPMSAHPTMPPPYNAQGGYNPYVTELSRMPGDPAQMAPPSQSLYPQPTSPPPYQYHHHPPQPAVPYPASSYGHGYPGNPYDPMHQASPPVQFTGPPPNQPSFGSGDNSVNSNPLDMKTQPGR